MHEVCFGTGYVSARTNHRRRGPGPSATALTTEPILAQRRRSEGDLNGVLYR